MNTNLILIRHGESQWNKENKFTGWIDIGLSDKGRSDSKKTGKLLKQKKFIFDYGYTSVLKRSIHTLWIILDQLDQSWLPINKSWRLNERHYGTLQGLNKDESIKKYGKSTIQQWRRSLNAIPPQINNKNDLYSGINDIRYVHISDKKLPIGESLALTIKRVMPLWFNSIKPKIKNKKKVIVVAHGNSIRAMIKIINGFNESEIFNINVPTSTPLVYEFDQDVNLMKYYYLL